MRRRNFVAVLGGAASWPLAAHAQLPPMPVIGFLRTAFDGADDFVAAFRRGLRETGFIEGQNVTIEFRSAENRNDRLPALVAELLRIPVNIIVGNSPSALAAKAASTTVPIVFAAGGDPVREGLVASLNRPGGNVTGVTFLNNTLSAKQLELLRELVPAATTIGLLADSTNSSAPFVIADVQEAARALGVRIVVANFRSEQEIDAAFARFEQQQAAAFMVSGGPLALSRRHQIIALAARHALPAMYENRAFTAAGGLMSYSGSIPEAYRQVGVYAGRILRGVSPAELPVMQSTRVELVINLRTARTLGLTVPLSLMVSADEVIE
jgi:putative tryptophan/tyrosine transport system substrate-binding protein